MSFLMPKMTAMPAIPEPQPLPDPPKYDDAQRKEDAARKRARLKNMRTGRSSTILTGTDGLEDDDSKINKKELLGG